MEIIKHLPTVDQFVERFNTPFDTTPRHGVPMLEQYLKIINAVLTNPQDQVVYGEKVMVTLSTVHHSDKTVSAQISINHDLIGWHMDEAVVEHLRDILEPKGWLITCYEAVDCELKICIPNYRFAYDIKTDTSRIEPVDYNLMISE